MVGVGGGEREWGVVSGSFSFCGFVFVCLLGPLSPVVVVGFGLLSLDFVQRGCMCIYWT